jgi:hypothetical protein
MSTFLVQDPVVRAVIDKFAERSALGIRKYGTTLERNDLAPHEWANHVQEELMDAVLYLEKLKQVLRSMPVVLPSEPPLEPLDAAERKV